jgi:lysophospholipase
VRDLRDRGFAVAMIDWRGQGHSSRRLRDPRKGYVRDFSDFEVDVETFVQQVVLPDCPPPHFALAHSMGGAVMLRVAHAGKALVRPHGAVGADDRPARARTGFRCARCCAAMRLAGQGGRYIPGGSDALTGADPSSTIPSPAIPCATPATPRSWRKIRRSASARRRWPGPIPRSGRCTASRIRIIRRRSASRS